MDFLLKHLNDFLEIPMSTLTLIAVMSGVAMYFIRDHLVIPGLVVVLFPFVVTVGALANYVFTKLEMFPLNKYDQWLICTIISATIGVMVGLVVTALIAHIAEGMESKQNIVRKS